MSDLPAAGGRQEPQGNEEFMLEPVPLGARRSWWAMFAIWVDFGYVPTGLIVGGQLAGQGGQPGMPFGQALLAIATGEGLLLALTFLLGYAAMRTGLNLSLISRISYGRKGMVLPMLIMACLTLGWFASITGMVGDIFKAALGDVTGVTMGRRRRPRWRAPSSRALRASSSASARPSRRPWPPSSPAATSWSRTSPVWARPLSPWRSPAAWS